MTYEQNYDPFGNARDGIDALRTISHLANQDKQNALLAEQVRLQREALELEKKKLAQEQEKINLEREKLKQQGTGQVRQTSPSPPPPRRSPVDNEDRSDWDVRHDLIAQIKEEKSQACKRDLLAQYEHKFGPADSYEKRNMGIRGY